MPLDVFPEDWAILRQWLPSDLAERAKTHHFLRRARGVEDAELWLRLILMHVAGGLSLEQTALRAAELGWVEISAVALFKRLRQAQAWLADLTSHLLAEQQQRLRRSDWPTKWAVRLIDATDVQEPGSTGTAWRLHYSLRLPQLVCDHLELTDGHGGEKLARFPFAPGELAVADRGYSHRAGLAHVLRAGADVLVRWQPGPCPLQTGTGEKWQPLPWLRRLPARSPREHAVFLEHGGERYALRFCAVRKSRVAAERARRKVERKAKHRGDQLAPATLEYADYVIVVCSPTATALTTVEALELYRGRWQVELAFKRLKSLLDAGHVPKKDDASARAWMQAKVLSALLLERVLWEGNFVSPWGYLLGGGGAPQPLAALS
jgi:hypothetical protein